MDTQAIEELGALVASEVWMLVEDVARAAQAQGSHCYRHRRMHVDRVINVFGNTARLIADMAGGPSNVFSKVFTCCTSPFGTWPSLATL